MKKIISSIAVFVMTLAGCATPGMQGLGKTESTAVGATVGCAAGAVLAKVTGSNAGVGCALGAVAGGLYTYTQARKLELASIKESAAQLPNAQVETQLVTATDRATGDRELVETFHSLTVPLPASSLTDKEGKRVYANLAQIAQKHTTKVTIAGGTPVQRKKAADLFASHGVLKVHEDPAVKATAGRKSDLLIILAPSDTSASVSV